MDKIIMRIKIKQIIWHELHRMGLYHVTPSGSDNRSGPNDNFMDGNSTPSGLENLLCSDDSGLNYRVGYMPKPRTLKGSVPNLVKELTLYITLLPVKNVAN
jgi:hypothetical protein